MDPTYGQSWGTMGEQKYFDDPTGRYRIMRQDGYSAPFTDEYGRQMVYDKNGNVHPYDPTQTQGYNVWDTQTQMGGAYDASGKYIGALNLKQEIDPMDLAGIMMIAAPIGAAVAGAGAGAAGAGASATGGTGAATGAGITGFGDAGLMYGGLDAAAAGSLGGGASIAGGAALGAGGLGSVAGGIGGSSGGLSSMISQLSQSTGMSWQQAASLAAKFITGGGGGSGGGSGLNDLLSLIGGGVDAQRQGDAAEKMKAWLDSQSNKMEGYMNPNSPEYQALWQEMSRKDAAAGRNSQYGPRTSDFLANVAKSKAQNTLNFTTGTSRAYSEALNQDAAKYSGLLSALQHGATGGSGNSSSLISLLSKLGSSYDSGNMTTDDWMNLIGSEGAPIDYGAGMGDPTEADVWDYILREQGF